MSKTIAFRVDGGPRIGMGHFARCRALADECRARGWKVFWFSSSPSLRSHVSSGETFVRIDPRWDDSQQARRIARKLVPGSFVVLDGYHLGRKLEEELVDGGMRVLTLDDNARRSFAAHWVTNGNVHARRLRYRTHRRTRLALGPSYYLLSREVVRAGRRAPRRRVRVRRIFVTMGGADPGNVTMKVIRALDSLRGRDFSMEVVAGSANPHFRKLRAFARKSSHPCRLWKTTDRIGALMARADLGVASAGRVGNEMLRIGLPGVRIVLADNQLGLVRTLAREGAVLNLGWHRRLSARRIASAVSRLMDDVALRRKMSDKGRSMIDGNGTRRVMRILAR